MSKMPDYIELHPAKLLKNNPTIKYKNKFIHSQYDPVRQAKQELHRYPNLIKSKLVVVVGVGYGYILDALNNIITVNTKVIVVDREPYFENFIDKNFLDKSNFKFFWAASGYEINEYLTNNFFEYDLKNITIIENTVLTAIDKNYYDNIKSKILEFFKMRTADITTTAYFSDIWLRNILYNFKYLNKVSFINRYKNIFKDVPVLFVSASPFLENHIAIIKEFKGYIFALAPAAEYLIKHNVIPDFVISTDANYYNLFHLIKYRNVNLITELSVHPAVLSNWSGNIIIMDFNLPPTSIIKKIAGDIGIVPQGGTVSVTALYLFNYLGVKNVFMAGQDFTCYGFKAHCSGSGYDKVYLLRNNRYNRLIHQNFLQIYNNKLIYINNNITTDSKLVMYKNWFDKVVRELNLKMIPLSESLTLKVEKSKFTYKREKIDYNKLFDYINKISDIISRIDIKIFNSFGELLRGLQKDMLLYNLFSMLMYRDLMKYQKLQETEEYYFDRFNEVRKFLLQLFEVISIYIPESNTRNTMPGR